MDVSSWIFEAKFNSAELYQMYGILVNQGWLLSESQTQSQNNAAAIEMAPCMKHKTDIQEMDGYHQAAPAISK